MPYRFVGVVLCGGASRRMGSDKALAAFDGQPLVQVAVDALMSAGAESVTAIGGDREALARLGLTVVADRYPDEGPLGAIITALSDAGLEPSADDERLVMVLTCDLVAITAAEVGAILATLHADERADVAAPIVDRRVHYLTGAYRRRAVIGLQRHFDAGERAVRRAASTLVLARVEGLNQASLADADTPEDLVRALSRARSID